MCQYLQMLMTHPHSPAAARDLFLMFSAVKPGWETNSFSHFSTHWAGMLSLSKVSRPFRKAFRSPMNFLAAGHDRSFGILPAGAVRTMQAASTDTISGAGVLNDRSSPSDFLSRLFSAASACAMIGSASFRSSAQDACWAITSAAMLAQASSSSRPAATASSTTAFSLPMDTISASVAAFFSSTTTCSALSASCSWATWADAWAILSTPFSSRSWFARKSSRLLASRLLYRLMSSRKDLGVV